MKLFSKNNDDQMPLDIFSDDENQPQHKKIVTAPHVLTKDEVLSGEKSNIQKNSKSALDALKERVKLAAEEATNTIKGTAAEPVIKSEPIKEEKIPEAVLITEEIKVIKPEKKDIVSETDKNTENEESQQQKPSLYDKCKPFLLNDDGTEDQHLTKPLYKLQSVAEILNKDSKDALDRLSEQYEFTYEPKLKGAKTVPSKPIVQNAVFEKKSPSTTLPQINKVKNPQSNVTFVISDIDAPSTSEPEPKSSSNSVTATITFTPVVDNDGSDKRIAVSQNTRSIDLTGEIMKMPDEAPEIQESVKLENNEFEEFIPNEEILCEKTSAKIIRKLALEKRNRFIGLLVSAFFLVALAFFKLPFMDGFFIENPTAAMTVCTVLTGVIAFANGDMLLSLKEIVSKNGKPDILLSIATVITFVYSGFAISDGTRFYEILLCLGVILTIRSIAQFFKTSSLLMGAKTIVGQGTKNAVRLINEPEITFAMAKNAIEGDVLIAASQKTETVGDFMKYSTYGKLLGGKFPIVVIASVLMALLLGVGSYSYFGTINDGLYAAAAVMLICSSPVVFFIDVLPFYRASKKLYAKHACIAGKTGAQSIEFANALVLNAADIFPSGTVTLHNMKVLTENDLEDTLIRAAVLTESANSPLAPIFKKIAGTGNVTEYPDSDTVKYEDRMGISGWVDNRLLFIGNRTLMEAHGIEVPSLEVDRKILRQGYFPVYLATRDKACALLAVQYSVDKYVQKELQKLTRLGVTVLVNSTDPNLTNEMICDYLELYDDAVFVMATVGCHVLKNTVVEVKQLSAPAAYRGSSMHLASIVNAAARIKASNILLTVLYVLALVLGITMFVYSSFSVSGTLWSAGTLLIYSLLSALISYLLYLIKRP